MTDPIEVFHAVVQLFLVVLSDTPVNFLSAMLHTFIEVTTHLANTPSNIALRQGYRCRRYRCRETGNKNRAEDTR